VSSTSSPDVSVVVCAYTLDRWPDIVAGIEALAHQTVAPLETLLVVDGNPELLARAQDAFPHVRVVPNVHSQGISGARNTGIGEAKGGVIAFLDDDARPEPDWVEQLLTPYAESAVMAVGGKAVPSWPDRRPDHLVPELDWVVGCSYRGMPVDTADVRNAMGCNMSMRRTVFDAAGTFDESIGRIGKIPLGCDETELCIRLAQRIPGARVVYEPRALVHHRVTEPRTTWHYLRTRSYAEGRSKALIGRLVGNADATSVERTYVSRTLTAAVRRELGQGLRGRASGWRGAAGIVLALAATSWGYALGRLSRQRLPGSGAGT
jgi:glucosyl-dolichyl phosphate glucuronosyltransferase